MHYLSWYVATRQLTQVLIWSVAKYLEGYKTLLAVTSRLGLLYRSAIVGGPYANISDLHRHCSLSTLCALIVIFCRVFDFASFVLFPCFFLFVFCFFVFFVFFPWLRLIPRRCWRTSNQEWVHIFTSTKFFFTSFLGSDFQDYKWGKLFILQLVIYWWWLDRR